MDFNSFNRTVLNRRNINYLNTKTIVFVVGVVEEGEVGIEVRFPHTGKIVDVYATCGNVGEDRTVIQIDKCPDDLYNTSLQWENIFLDNLIIDPNDKSNKTSNEPYTINPLHTQVNVNDHFRVNFIEVGAGISDVTIEIVVELDLE